MRRTVLLIAALTWALPGSAFGQNQHQSKPNDVGALAGGAIGAGTGALAGAERPCSAGTSCCVSASGEAAKPNAKLVAELMDILNETESPDTFLLTLTCLESVEVEPVAVLPALLRNAERLGITEGIVNRLNDSAKPANAKAEAVAKQQEALLHSLEHFLKACEGAREKKDAGGKGVVPPCVYGSSSAPVANPTGTTSCFSFH
jgi:hypothetical protein